MAPKLHDPYRKTQELQEVYSRIHQKKTTPPPQIHKVVEDQMPASTIQQKAEELYKTLQTPPPQESNKLIDHFEDIKILMTFAEAETPKLRMPIAKLKMTNMVYVVVSSLEVRACSSSRPRD